MLLTQHVVDAQCLFYLWQEDFQANAATMTAMAANPALLQAQAASQMTNYLMGSPYHPANYPAQYAAAQVPGAAGYRYPLLPGYPAQAATTPHRQAAPTVAPHHASSRMGEYS